LLKSRRGESLFPRMFLCGMSPDCPSTSSRPPLARRNPRGLPQTQQAQSLWTRTPRMRHLYSPCSRGMARARPRPWIQSRFPARRIGETNTLLGWTEVSFPRTDQRPDASPGWPSQSPLSMASCTSALRQASCSDVCHPSGARAPPGHSRGRVRPPRSATHPHGQQVLPGLLLAHCGR
jgi:hypothetical protein